MRLERHSWYAITFPRVPLWHVRTVLSNLGEFLPPDGWYYGSREDHQEESLYRGLACRRVHSCIVVFLACGKPCLASAVEEIARKVLHQTPGQGQDAGAPIVTPCPPHANDQDVYFAPVRDWVMARVDFISAAGRVPR